MIIRIKNKIISKNSPCFIIAEVGVNHNGSIKIAKKLIDSAIKCGADAVKFQTFITDQLIRKDAPKAKYQTNNIGAKKTQYQMLKELELDANAILTLKKYCDKKRILFLSTTYDDTSLKLLEKVNVPLHKLASMDVVFHPLIKKIAKTGKPLILSTGMANQAEIKSAVKIYKSIAKSIKKLILLQCNTNYPANLEDQNLLGLKILNSYVPFTGFSDHTNGNESSIAAITLGAKVIERHFTLDKKLRGPDHKASLNPKEFFTFVKSIRNTERALGKEIKQPSGAEKANLIMMRRSICAKKDIPKGTLLTEKHFCYKRPATGLLPTQENINKLLNKKTKIDIQFDQNITNTLVK